MIFKGVAYRPYLLSVFLESAPHRSGELVLLVHVLKSTVGVGEIMERLPRPESFELQGRIFSCLVVIKGCEHLLDALLFEISGRSVDQAHRIEHDGVFVMPRPTA
jgi:hypothetical protein